MHIIKIIHDQHQTSTKGLILNMYILFSFPCFNSPFEFFCNSISLLSFVPSLVSVSHQFSQCWHYKHPIALLIVWAMLYSCILIQNFDYHSQKKNNCLPRIKFRWFQHFHFVIYCFLIYFLFQVKHHSIFWIKIIHSLCRSQVLFNYFPLLLS